MYPGRRGGAKLGWEAACRSISITKSSRERARRLSREERIRHEQWPGNPLEKVAPGLAGTPRAFRPACSAGAWSGAGGLVLGVSSGLRLLPFLEGDGILEQRRMRPCSQP